MGFLSNQTVVYGGAEVLVLYPNTGDVCQCGGKQCQHTAQCGACGLRAWSNHRGTRARHFQSVIACIQRPLQSHARLQIREGSPGDQGECDSRLHYQPLQSSPRGIRQARIIRMRDQGCERTVEIAITARAKGRFTS
jgi:hypothetical protein